jgi:hypothetical protein
VANGDLWGETVNPDGASIELAAPEAGPGMLVWTARDLPARPRHNDHRLGDQIPWIAVGAAATWDELLAGLGTHIREAAMEKGQLDSILVELEKETPFLSDRDLLEGITTMVNDRTELVSYRPWVLMPLPRTVAGCLERSVATPVERCGLVLAACRTRGLRADPAFPSRWGAQSVDVPALEALSNPLLKAVDSDGNTWWIDPVEGSVLPMLALEGQTPYFIVEDDGVYRQVTHVVANRVSLSVFWDLESGEARGEGTIAGPCAAALDYEEPENLLRTWVEGWCDSVEVDHLRIMSSGPQGLTYSLNLSAPLPPADDRSRIVLDLPRPPVEFDRLLPPGADLGQSSVDGVLFPPAPVSFDLTWKVRCPDDVLLLPGPAVRKDWEDLSLTVMREESGSLIEVECALHWGGRPILPGEYPAYRDILLDVSDGRTTQIVLSEK